MRELDVCDSDREITLQAHQIQDDVQDVPRGVLTHEIHHVLQQAIVLGADEGAAGGQLQNAIAEGEEHQVPWLQGAQRDLVQDGVQAPIL